MTSTNTKIILGIDEVGRGPWAGPLVVGAVILGSDFYNHLNPNETSDLRPTERLTLYQNLADSKQLTPKKRTTLAPLIHQYAAAATTGWVTARELDQYGLSASLKLATRRAVKQILSAKIAFSEIIIDGTVNFLQNTPLADRVTVLKKADGLIKEVSAASIIAKVARDNYMIELASQYPEYGFDQHVGYGTAKHKSALLAHGVCPEHRRSFRPIRAILDQTEPRSSTLPDPNLSLTSTPNPDNPTSPTPNSTTKGQNAENLVARHLESLSHTIIAHNFKTKTYEIDLISTQNDKIFFTEVKYRQDDHHGSALEQVTPTKHQQMHYAAKKFLSDHSELAHLQPLLAVASVEREPPTLKAWFPLDI